MIISAITKNKPQCHVQNRLQPVELILRYASQDAIAVINPWNDEWIHELNHGRSKQERRINIMWCNWYHDWTSPLTWSFISTLTTKNAPRFYTTDEWWYDWAISEYKCWRIYQQNLVRWTATIETPILTSLTSAYWMPSTCRQHLCSRCWLIAGLAAVFLQLEDDYLSVGNRQIWDNILQKSR